MEGAEEIMSKFVDERVVEMSFDNKKFESNVKTSMGTINDLKNSLDFSGTANSLNKQLNHVDVSGLSGAILSAKNSFTAFEIAGIAAIANITNRVIDLGIQMVKSLSTDQIASGWEKFGQTATSEATLLAQGFEQADVTNILEKLLWYSDETSYSFTDMVDNMSKFTASGQGLDESAKAMMGIANWAALSGQNAGVASRAMYQLSQAMATGSVRLMDYKSIQNANMDTKEFRETVLSTAVAMEQLIQNVDGTYTTLSGKTFTAGQFTMELDELWFTSDVLMESLDKYSSGSEKLYEKIAEDSSINTASQAIEKYGEELGEFELKAFLAAQEARTFKDAIVAVKDAVASGWMNIFTNIFGSVAEAKILWTNFANELYDVFMDGMWTKIDILGIWSDNGGRDDLFANTEENTGAFWNLFNAIVAIKDLIGGAWQKVFGLSALDDYDEQIEEVAGKLKNFTESLKEWTEGLFLSGEATEALTNIFTGLFSILKITGKALISVWKGFYPLLEVIKPLLGYILGALGLVGKEITEFAEQTTVFERITKGMQTFFTTIIEFVKSLELLEGVKIFLDSFRKSLNKVIGDTDTNVSAMSNLKAVINSITEAFKWLGEIVAKYVLPNLPRAFEIIGEGLGFVVGHTVKFIGKIGELIKKFIEWVRINVTFQNGISSLGNVVDYISETFKKLIESITSFFKEFRTVSDGVEEDSVTKFNPLKDFVEGLLNLFEGLWNLLKAIMPVVGAFFSFIGKALTYIGDKLKSIFTTGDGEVNFKKLFTVGFWAVVAVGVYRFADLLRSITAVFRDAFDGLFDFVNSQAMAKYMEAIKTMAISILLMVGALLILGSMDTDVLKKSMIALGVLVGFIVGVMLLMKNLVAGSATKSIIKDGPATIKNTVQMTANLAGLAAAFIGIGVAVLLLSTSLKMLSKLDPEKMMAGLFFIALLMGMMVVVMKTVSKSERETNKAIKSMVKVAISIALLARPLKTIGSIDVTTGAKGLAGIALLMLILTGYSRYARTIDKSQRPVNGLLSTAVSLTLLIVPFKIIGAMDIWSIAKSLVAIFAIFKIIAYTSKIMRTSDAKRLQAISWQLTIVAVGLAAFGIAMKIVSQNSGPELGNAGLAMLGIFSLLVLVSKAMKLKDTNRLKAISWQLIVIATGLAAFGIAMKIVSQNDWPAVWMSLVSIAGVLSIMSTISKKLTPARVKNLSKMIWMLVPLSVSLSLFGISMAIVGSVHWTKILLSILTLYVVLKTLIIIGKTLTNDRVKNLSKMIWMLIPLSVSMAAFGVSMTILGSIHWTKILSSLATITVVLLILSGISMLLKSAGSGPVNIILLGVALVTLSIGMVALSVGILALGNIPFEKVLIGLGAVIGILAILAVASVLLGPLVILMLALAGTMALFALSVFLLAAGLTALAALSTVSAVALAAGIIAIAEAIVLAAPAIKKALWAIASIIIEVITEIIPAIVDAIDSLLRKVLPVLGKLLVDLTWDLLVWLVKITWEGLKMLGPILWQGIKWLGVTIWNGTKAVFAGIAGLFKKSNEWLHGAIIKISIAIIAGVKKAWAWLTDIVSRFGNWLWKSIINLATGLVDGIKNVWHGVTTWLGNAAKSISSLFREAFSSLVQIGKEVIQFLKSGIEEKWEELKTWVKDKAGSVGKWFSDGWDALKEAGKNIIEGLIKGIKDAWNSIPDILAELGGKAVEFFSKLLGINSPSTVFAEIGKYLDLGLAKGIEDNADSVYDATGSLGDDAADGVKNSGLSKVLSDLNKSLESDFDNQIVLTPVLDLSEIQNGKNQLYSMLDHMDSSYDISGSNDIANRTANDIDKNSRKTRHSDEESKQGTQVSEVVYNNFSITGPNPKEIANEVSRILQSQVDRRRAKWGT